MKKRAMKKYIPRNTHYCYGGFKSNKCGLPVRSGYCKNLVFKGIRTDFYIWDEKEENPLKRPIYKCRYTGTEPMDDCKDCCVGYPKYNDYDFN